MSGETNLVKLIQNMRPVLATECYVFAHVADVSGLDLNKVFARINEPEGVTLIVESELAKTWNLEASSLFSLITLQIHSSLEAVGLTAAFSKTLADNGISANVIAGFYHDHILVAQHDAERAIKALEAMTQQ